MSVPGPNALPHENWDCPGTVRQDRCSERSRRRHWHRTWFAKQTMQVRRSVPEATSSLIESRRLLRRRTARSDI